MHRHTHRHTHAMWIADIRNPSAREHLWRAVIRPAYTTASSAVVDPFMYLRSSHLVGDQFFDCRDTAVAAACSLRHVFPSRPEFGCAPIRVRKVIVG